MGGQFDDVSDGLSEEELEALKDEDEGSESTDAADEGGGEASDDSSDEEDGKQSQQDDTDTEDADESEDEDAASEGGEEEKNESESEDAESDSPKDDPPKEDVQDDDQGAVNPIPELEEKLKDLKAKFDEGEIDLEKYLDERSQAERAIIKAEMTQEFARQKVEDAWRDSQERFFKDNAYLKGNDVLYGAFAAQVNKILQTSEGAALSNEAILDKAKAVVDSAFGRKEEPKPEKKADPVKDAKKAAADKSKLPQTLRDVPAADVNEDKVGKFAYLDKLEGEEFEAAIEKLSSAELEAWANEG